MILIGESIHIIAMTVSQAIEERNARVVQGLVMGQTDAGADYIELNLGPARKVPEETMQWLVRVVQEVTDLPLSLDTTNPVAMEAGLKVCKQRALINSASGKRESRERMLPLAVKYPAEVIISVLTDEGIPAGADSRAESIMETLTIANEMGIANENIWVDPILMPVSVDQKAVYECLEFIEMLPDLAPGIKSVVGLSNLSNGTPRELRGILNRTYMVMLEKYNQYGAIVNVFDEELVRLNRGEMPQVVALIHRVMDGEDIDLALLSPREREYVKTTEVLMGQSLYSHSWLET